MRKEGQPESHEEFEKLTEEDKSRLGLHHHHGSLVAHARVILDDHEAGPVTVHYINSEGTEVVSQATQYDWYWSHPVKPDTDYTFCARWENSVDNCPSIVVFERENIKSIMPPEMFRDPSEYQE